MTNASTKAVTSVLANVNKQNTNNKKRSLYIISKRNIKKDAQRRNRTADTRIFSPLLYRLSYLGIELRGKDLNQRPSGYEPDELPDCSTPR